MHGNAVPEYRLSALEIDPQSPWDLALRFPKQTMMFTIGAVAILTAPNDPQAGVVDQCQIPLDHVLAVGTQHLHLPMG